MYLKEEKKTFFYHLIPYDIWNEVQWQNIDELFILRSCGMYIICILGVIFFYHGKRFFFSKKTLNNVFWRLRQFYLFSKIWTGMGLYHNTMYDDKQTVHSITKKSCFLMTLCCIYLFVKAPTKSKLTANKYHPNHKKLNHSMS